MEADALALGRAGASPCIWVQCGVLDYRLCDRDFDCESCPLFHALRGTAPEFGPRSGATVDPGEPLTARDDPLERQVNEYLAHLLAGCRLYPDRYCAQNFWLTEGPGEAVTLGLHDHLVRLLSPIADIVAPRAGMRVKRGAPCGWITREGLALTLSMPVSGRIADVNAADVSRLRNTPRAVPGDWLLHVTECAPLEGVAELRRGEETVRWYLAKIRLCKQFLRDAIRPDSEHGLADTAADGGVPTDDLEQVLGTAAFERLVERVL